MKDKIFLLLGGNSLGFGIYEKFKKMGCKIYVIDWNETPQIKGDKHYQIDVKNPDEIITALKNDGIFDNVFFAYSSIDLAVPSVAKINKEIGLNVISKEALTYATSKSKMTEKWNEKNILNKISLEY